MPSDSSFVKAFSDLAHASISEKSPGLMEYLVGFQLIDKNDEDTHAIGVFGFKTGNQWFYVPVFFLNGSLKGMDLLYVKGQDLFVPLQDNWVNYLLSKQPRKLGQTEQIPEQKLNITQPDFRVFSESPGTSGTKWASEIRTNRIQPWARDFLPAYQKLVSAHTKTASAFSRFDLRNAVREHPELAVPLLTSMQENIKFAEAVLSFYDLKDIMPDVATVKRAYQDMQGGYPGSVVKPGQPGGLPGTQGPSRMNVAGPKNIAPTPGSKPSASTALPATSVNKNMMPPVGTGVKGASNLATEQAEKTSEYVGDNHKYGYSQHFNSTDEVLASLVGARRGQTKKAADEKSPNEAEAKIRKTEGPKDADVDIEQRQMRDKNSPDVQVFTQEDSPAMLSNLSDKEKEQLRRGEIVIKDHRDNTSTVFNAEYDRHLTNPTETGIYDVMTSMKGLERCFVITDPKTIGKGRSSGVCTVVALDGKKYGNFRNLDILVSQAEAAKGSFQDRFAEVYGKCKPLTSMKSGYEYILVGPDGKASIPFKYLTSVSSNDGTAQYYVKPDTHVVSCRSQVRSTLDKRWDRPMGIQLDDTGSDGCCAVQGGNSAYDSKTKKKFESWELNSARVIMASDRANVSTLKNVGITSFVPADTFKVFEIGRADGDVEAKDVVVKLDPGTMADAEMYIMKLGAEQLIVHADGPEVILQSSQGQMRLRKEAALCTLVTGWGLKGDDARTIVKKAARTPIEYYVKLAEGLDTPPTAPYQPPYVGTYNQQIGVPVTEQQSHFLPVLGMIPKAENRNVYTLMGQKPVYNMAMDAAQRGDKDVFDTSVIGGLVKAVDVDKMIDSFLPDMIKGMDRVGRSLFMFYWHNEAFKERYGRQDLIDLEDSLRNVLKSVGDLVIFLKQKGADGDPMFDAMDINLDAISKA